MENSFISLVIVLIALSEYPLICKLILDELAVCFIVVLLLIFVPSWASSIGQCLKWFCKIIAHAKLRLSRGLRMKNVVDMTTMSYQILLLLHDEEIPIKVKVKLS